MKLEQNNINDGEYYEQLSKFDRLVEAFREKLASLGIDFNEDVFYRNYRVKAYIDYTDFILDIKFKAALYEMKIRMATVIGAIKRLERELLASVSLLYGLCSSQSSFIFRAFYGTSLFRTPSL